MVAGYVVRWDSECGADYLREFARRIAGRTSYRKAAYVFDRKVDAECLARRTGGVVEEI